MKKDTYNVEGIEIEVEHIDRNDGNREHRLVTYQFKTIREQSGMNRKEFSEWLGIPYRTMQEWELGRRQMPDYVLRLIAYKVKMEKERGEPMMTVLYGVGTVLRVILRISLLPVQAVLTLLMLAIGFIGGLANIVCWLLGAFFVIGGICSFINGSTSLGWQGVIVGIIVAVVP